MERSIHVDEPSRIDLEIMRYGYDPGKALDDAFLLRHTLLLLLKKRISISLDLVFGDTTKMGHSISCPIFSNIRRSAISRQDISSRHSSGEISSCIHTGIMVVYLRSTTLIDSNIMSLNGFGVLTSTTKPRRSTGMKRLENMGDSKYN